MNKVIIKGRLTADPELSNTVTGVEYCNFAVAVDRYAGKDKEKETDFIPCKAWRQTAVFINKYFVKGQEILILGSIRFDKYEKDGEKKRIFASVSVENVEFCGSKSDSKPSLDVKHNGDSDGCSATAAYTDPASDYAEIGTDDDLLF